MYTEDCIDYLNRYGVITSAWLMMKLRVTLAEARQILDQIVAEHENVHYTTYDHIYIEGTEPLHGLPKKRKRVYVKKLSKWKDIRKP